MNAVTKIEDWGNAHRPGWIDIFRIIVGIFITYKGASFVSNIESLQMSLQGVNMLYTGVALSHYVIFAHILCGPLLTINSGTGNKVAQGLPARIKVCHLLTARSHIARSF